MGGSIWLKRVWLKYAGRAGELSGRILPCEPFFQQKASQGTQIIEQAATALQMLFQFV